jgi:hypothetical protein
MCRPPIGIRILATQQQTRRIKSCAARAVRNPALLASRLAATAARPPSLGVCCRSWFSVSNRVTGDRRSTGTDEQAESNRPNRVFRGHGACGDDSSEYGSKGWRDKTGWGAAGVGTQITPVVRPLTPVYRRIGWRPCDHKGSEIADCGEASLRPPPHRPPNPSSALPTGSGLT